MPSSMKHFEISGNVGCDIRIANHLGNFGASCKARTIGGISNRDPLPSNLAETLGLRVQELAGTIDSDLLIVVGFPSDNKEHRIRHLGMEVCRVDLGCPDTTTLPAQGVDDGLVCHPNSPDELERIFGTFKETSNQIYVLPHVIHRLADPRPVLKSIRACLIRNPMNRLIITVPTKDSTVYDNPNSLPPNQSFFRIWSPWELLKFCASCGFKAEFFGQVDETSSSFLLLELSCSDNFYREFLSFNGLPHESRCLIITAEHSKTKLSGGIGTYVEQVERILDVRPLILFLGSLGVDSENARIFQDERWLCPMQLFPLHDCEQSIWPMHRYDMAELAWLTVEQVLFYYPGVKFIEYQDYGGLGCRIAQAKKSGHISSEVFLETVSHGTSAYLENTGENWITLSGHKGMLKEKVAIELADAVRFSTRYMEDLYAEKGYEIQADKKYLLRLPFCYDLEPETAFDSIKNLIFFGRRSVSKGFVEFAEAIHDLEQTGDLAKIRKIVLIGPRDNELAFQNNYMDQLKSLLAVEEYSLPRMEALNLLGSMASDSLCVTPYRGDAHSLTTLEAINLNCQLLATHAGGIPEIIPGQFHSKVLCEPNGRSIADAIRNALSLDAAARSNLVKEMRTACLIDQENINKSLCERYRTAASLQKKSVTSTCHPELISVVVPCFNSDLKFISELIYGINNQSLLPKEVIFVDDGSARGYREKLYDRVSQDIAVPFKILHHESNQGLPRARNTALHFVNTKYVMYLDSDDIACNDTLYEAVRHLENNPEDSMVTHYIEYFENGENWQESNWSREVYLPLGQSLVLGQLENIFGSSAAVFRTDYLKQIGGWDDTDASMWEDWALYLKITAREGKIGTIPKIGCLCRVRSDSMRLTYRIFPAQARLARNSDGQLSRFDAYRLQAILRGLAIPFDDLNRPAYRITRRIIQILDKAPRLKSALYKGMLLAWNNVNYYKKFWK